MRGHSRRAGRRFALIATTTTLAAVALGASATPSFALDLRVPTTTTLVASPSVLGPSGSATLTASVRPGLFVGPLGKIKFTDSKNGAVLGTVEPKLTCLLRREPCVATITVPASALAAGDNTIVAAYSGGLFTKPSTGSADVFVGTQNTCQSGSGDCSTSATSSDGSTSTTIDTTAPSSGTETVQAFFTNETPPSSSCQTVGAGDTLVYSVNNPGGQSKTVTLTLNGAAADAEHALDPDSFGNVCFGSPTSFTTNANQPATFNQADGLFYGNLPLCDDEDGDNDNNNNESGGHLVVPAGAFPCINFVDSAADTWASYTKGSGSTPSTYTESFTTTVSDPKAHG
jgi:hypothetical protein